ncbi:nucleotidyltransferase family protein [Undibacterium sp.]|uniref:nucleotidyltransferase domain-containing protein n=1 Tax=Undibacterium sp. TaxID=1914977 RepID=UPI00374D2054
MNKRELLLDAFRAPQGLAALDLPAWDMLLRQARTANLQSSLYYLLADRGLLQAVPEPARRHLEWSHYLAQRHTQAVLWEIGFIKKAMEYAGLRLVILKGAAYVLAKLPHARGRIFSDIDIIVPKEKLGDAETSLMVHGWHATHHDEYDQRYYREWMHEIPPMENAKRQTVIDVHHAILPATAPVHPDTEKLLAAARPAGDSADAYVFSPADMVLHSAVHLFHDGEYDHGLRDLVDIHGLLLYYADTPGFWAALTERAQLLELTRPLFYALRYAALMLHTPVPAKLVQAADIGRPGPLLLKLMDQLFMRALLPKHPSCDDRWSGTARWILYIRANWLRMPPLLLARHLFHKAFLSPKDKE